MAGLIGSINPDEASATVKSAAMELMVAAAEDGVIGRGNGLPWRLSADLRRFKALTVGKHVLMGRRTFESIGRALPDRTNLVLTRSAGFHAPGCVQVDSLARACALAAASGGPLMIIGGAKVYGEALAAAARIHLTLVHTRIPDGDTFFDAWRGAEWCETSRERHEADDKNDFAYSFITLVRRDPIAVPAIVTGS